jgi:hypothetical protein
VNPVIPIGLTQLAAETIVCLVSLVGAWIGLLVGWR